MKNNPQPKLSKDAQRALSALRGVLRLHPDLHIAQVFFYALCVIGVARRADWSVGNIFYVDDRVLAYALEQCTISAGKRVKLK